ncbi:hypothetical protein B0H17DRAFT_1133422 [Mycena rosella]|uniref:Uncharacterized protein n=1 Tax=Mycena rosella TaxID=1033263 RepID=A0AAD7GFB5_MYCRO|nr:hypothetical protein B0H17DRAFT_1133422 [Mycena rosella]
MINVGLLLAPEINSVQLRGPWCHPDGVGVRNSQMGEEGVGRIEYGIRITISIDSVGHDGELSDGWVFLQDLDDLISIEPASKTKPAKFTGRTNEEGLEIMQQIGICIFNCCEGCIRCVYALASHPCCVENHTHESPFLPNWDALRNHIRTDAPGCIQRCQDQARQLSPHSNTTERLSPHSNTTRRLSPHTHMDTQHAPDASVHPNTTIFRTWTPSFGAWPLFAVDSTLIRSDPRARTCIPVGSGLHLSKGTTNTVVFCLVFELAPVHPLIRVFAKARHPEYECISCLAFRHFGLLARSRPEYECVGPWEKTMDRYLGTSRYTLGPGGCATAGIEEVRFLSSRQSIPDIPFDYNQFRTSNLGVNPQDEFAHLYSPTQYIGFDHHTTVQTRLQAPLTLPLQLKS